MNRALGRRATEVCAVHALRIGRRVTAALAVRDDRSVRSATLRNSGLLSELLSNLVSIVLVDTSSEKQFLPPLHVSGVIIILTGVGGFVFEDFDEFIETSSDDGSKDRSNPVDPVVAVEGVVDDSRAERTCRVE